MTGSVRQQIGELLRGEALSVRELAAALGLRHRETAEHLGHVLRSSGAEVTVQPAACVGCGFVFRKRERVGDPSRCPRCRSERIRPARYRIAPDG